MTLSIAADTLADRSGDVTIAGQRFTVAQTGLASPTCTFILSDTSDTIGASGGSASVTVTAADGCAWTAVSNASWIAVSSGQSGSGTGVVRLTFAANTGAQRTGTATIAGQTYTVTEGAAQGPACTFSLNPTAGTFPSNGGTTTVSVAAPGACAWTAIANVGWITIRSGAAGVGNGSVGLSIAANSGPQRAGTVTIAGQTFTATESAATITFSGTVSVLTGSCPSITFSAGGRTVSSNTGTDFKNGKCTDVKNGEGVTVTGDDTGTSNITASTIQLDR